MVPAFLEEIVSFEEADDGCDGDDKCGEACLSCVCFLFFEAEDVFFEDCFKASCLFCFFVTIVVFEEPDASFDVKEPGFEL